MPQTADSSSPADQRIDVDTAAGLAWVDLRASDNPRMLLMLGHGAGGAVTSPDLHAVSVAAVAVGVSVALVTQPYRVSGRRAPAAATRLDEAWLAVTEHLRKEPMLRGLPVVQGGRSSGARVACRCADVADAAGVVALAFPVHPPGRPERSRVSELEAVSCPLLVVQGARDAFGQPPDDLFDGSRRRLVRVRGTHALDTDLASVGRAVADFLAQL